MGRNKSKSKINQIEHTVPPGTNLHAGNAPNENLVDSTPKSENETLKEEKKLLLKKLDEKSAQNKLLKIEIQKLQEIINKGRNTENDMEHDISFIDVHSKVSTDIYKKPATQWTNADNSGNECGMQVEDSKGSVSWNEEGASGFETNASSACKQTNTNYWEESSDGRSTKQKNDHYRCHTENEYEDRNMPSSSRGTKVSDTPSKYHKHFYGSDGNYQQNRNRRDQEHLKRENYSQKSNKRDREFFRKENYSQKYHRVTLTEIDGDLFSAPENNSLAHCVAEDLRMGSGIAVQFRQQFKNVDLLLNQRKKVGDVAILEDKGRYIYYLITKKFSTGKPTLADLKDSLLEMRGHMEANAVMNLAIPRIGCGLDRLKWNDVRNMLCEVFADLDVTITVYNFTVSVNEAVTSQKKSRLHITDKLMKLVDIEKNTLLLLFGSECGYVDSTMEELDGKYQLIYDYRRQSRKLGDIVKIRKREEIICVLIVKTHHTNFISYPDLSECLLKVRKLFKEERYFYMGFSAFRDDNDDLTVAKIVSLFKIIFNYSEGSLWICWPPELVEVYNKYISGLHY